MSRSSIVVVGLLGSFVVLARLILACSEEPRESVRAVEPQGVVAVAVPAVALPSSVDLLAEAEPAAEHVRGARHGMRTAMARPESHARNHAQPGHKASHKKAAVHPHRAPKRAHGSHAPGHKHGPKKSASRTHRVR